MYTAEALERAEVRKNRRTRTLRRQQARRKAALFFCLTLLMMFGIGVGFGTLLTRAEEPQKAPSFKYYANVEISSGDTLWDLAETYMDGLHYSSRTDYINEVMSINHLVSDRLISGQKLILPYYSSELK